MRKCGNELYANRRRFLPNPRDWDGTSRVAFVSPIATIANFWSYDNRLHGSKRALGIFGNGHNTKWHDKSGAILSRPEIGGGTHLSPLPPFVHSVVRAKLVGAPA